MISGSPPAEAAARRAFVQAAWPAAIALALLALVLRSALGGYMPVGAIALGAFALAAGLVAIALSVNLAFDALLFRVIASYEDPYKGGAAVDDILSRMRLKPTATEVRPLADRIAGTERLMRRQRAALAICGVASVISIAM